jgi:S-(hydroxymethyl)glutathione dehydrogenase / alcohol dehydrogenase
MRAAMFVETGKDLVIENVEPAPPGPRDVIVQLGASGVCHSDLSLKNGFVPMPPGMVLGHEGAGTVVEVGSEVTKVQKGDSIIASFIPACGVCPSCLADHSHLCDTEFDVMMTPRGTRADGSGFMTMTGLGTFAEAMTVNQSSIVKVDTDIPFDQLALIGCGVTTGVGAALNTARVHPGASVAIIGCGGVGLSVMQGARIAGASRIIAIDQGTEKKAAAEAQGATDYVDGLAGDPVAQVQQLTGGRGVDYAFEVTIGTQETLTQAYNMIRKGGTLVMVSMPRQEGTFTLPTFDLFFNEKTVKGCKYGSSQVRRDFQRFVDLAETGRLDLGSMVSRHIKLDEVNDAFRAMENREVTRSVITSF